MKMNVRRGIPAKTANILLYYFKDVKIRDNTKLNLPDRLKNIYLGI